MRRAAPGIIIAALLFATVASAQPGPGRRGPPGGRGRPDMDDAPMPEKTVRPVDRNLPLARQIDQTIERGVKYLLSRQRADGAFDDDGIDTGESVGRTALAGLALLSCGVSHQSPELSKATEYLKRAKIEGGRATYCTALRAAYFSQLPESVRKQDLAMDFTWLQQAIVLKGNAAGMYTYFKPTRDGGWGDYSNSQYGVLGVWYAEMAGLEVPRKYWQLVEDCWRSGQNKDGGWGYYMADGDSYASMTAAGAATLYITYDNLHAQQEIDLKRVRPSIGIDQGVQWLGDHFAVDTNTGRDGQLNAPAPAGDGMLDVLAGGRRFRQIGSYVHYMLFGYERVGEASGLTRFGTHKWFEEGANFLNETQNTDGSWTGTSSYTVDTSYALLFLSRGRAPVAMQKLQFKGRWNNRSRDAATVVRWLTRQTERHTNWQIVPVEASPAEMREAPMLYVASDRPLLLRSADKERIKTYIDQGGLLLAVNEGRNATTAPTSGAAVGSAVGASDFAASIVALARELYPKYEFRNLPPDHPIFGENFPVKNLPTVPRGLSNGVRELMVLLPTGDMSWKFQQGAGTNNPAGAPSFGFLGNLYIYMNDKANPRFKGDDTWIDANPNVTDERESTLLRLKINANYNPEPLAWNRFANVLHNVDRIKLNVTEIDPGRAVLPTTAPLAHLTATNSFELSSTQSDQIKRYLDSGGVLLFDAAGGSTAGQLSFETLMLKLYPTAKLKTLDINHPILTGDGTGGEKIIAVTYRRYANERIAKTTLPRLRVLEINGKIVAIDSTEDLSAGLVGYNIDGIVGYSPASATQIVRNIVLWAMNRSSR